jgi:hypothetical protein
VKRIHLSEQDVAEILSVSKTFVETDGTGYKRRANYNYRDMNIGMAGERAYEIFTGYEWNKNASDHGGPRADFYDQDGNGIQVKTVSYNGPGPKELKLKRKETLKLTKPGNNIIKLVLCYYNHNIDPGSCYIIGEISTENFIKKRKIKRYNNNELDIVAEMDLDTIFS